MNKGSTEMILVIVILISIPLIVGGYFFLFKNTSPIVPIDTNNFQTTDAAVMEGVKTYQFSTFGNTIVVNLSSEWIPIKESEHASEEIKQKIEQHELLDGVFINNNYRISFLAVPLTDEDISIVDKLYIGTEQFAQKFLQATREELNNDAMYKVTEITFKGKPANYMTVDYGENELRAIQFIDNKTLYVFDHYGPKQDSEPVWMKVYEIFENDVSY